MEHDFWVISSENFWEQRVISTGSPVFPNGMLHTELNSCLIRPKPSLIPLSFFCSRFSVNGTDLYKMVNEIPGRNLPVLNFAYHLPKP